MSLTSKRSGERKVDANRIAFEINVCIKGPAFTTGEKRKREVGFTRGINSLLHHKGRPLGEKKSFCPKEEKKLRSGKRGGFAQGRAERGHISIHHPREEGQMTILLQYAKGESSGPWEDPIMIGKKDKRVPE